MQGSHTEAPAPEVQAARPGADRVSLGLLALALVLGLLRFWRLPDWSLWYDEAATWFDLQAGLSNPEMHNPLGYRAVGWVVQLCGGQPSEFSLRLLPAIAGWLVIPATWFAFRPFAGCARASAAALLVAASSWQLYWSQNARFYTLAQLFALLGGALLLRGLWRKRVLLLVLGSGLIGLAGLFHLSAVMLLPALALAPWLLAPLELEELRGSQRMRVLLLVLLGAGVLLGFAWALRAFQNFERHAPDFSTAHYLLTTGFYVTPLLGAGALVGVCAAWNRRSAFGLLVGVAVLLGLFAMLLCSTRVVVSAQYVFVFLPWIAILAAWPFEPPPSASPLERRLALSWLVLLVLPALASSALYFGARSGERPQWREAFELVWNQREPDDLVLCMEAPVGEYYLGPSGADLQNPEHVAWLDRWRSQRPREWAAHARRAWYVFNTEQLKGWDEPDAREFERFLRERCRLVKCFPLSVESRDLSVWVYLRG